MADRIKKLRALHGRWTRGGTIIGSPLGYTLVPAGWDGDAADLRHKQNTDEIKHLLGTLPALLDVEEAAREVREAKRDLEYTGAVSTRQYIDCRRRVDEAEARLDTALAALEGVGK